MSVTRVLLDILIVLLAAKVAAEAAERLKVPAVVGEILAGIVIGPSAFNLVRSGDVLPVLGELGVILLLLDVGMEMDLGELVAVGRASMAVATIGVAVPLVAGWATGSALGMSGKEALFVGAALTATSVGITARVFGDLRALTTVEARTVIGAAVADDIMGLVVLTVVVRVAVQGHVSLAAVGGVIGVAVLFLVATSLLGVRLAPRLFAAVARQSRSSGTLVAVALAFTLAIAELANVVKLAPIVGAFVAGVSLGPSPAADRIRREMTPVGHLFIPVFFLMIGIDAQVDQFAHPRVLIVAGALLAVAVAGKLVAAAGLVGSPGDRLLIGVAMVPRGEVGLIFATIGLHQHIFGQDVYAALLLVVLATTLLPPPVLRWRLTKMRARPSPAGPAAVRPDGGWLLVTEGHGGGTVELAADPPPGQALAVAFEAALLGERRRPGSHLLGWLGTLPSTPLQWDRAARARFFEVLDAAGPRSWRFLAVTGILDRALPELGAALVRRQADPFELDPTGAIRWPHLSRLQQLDQRRQLAHPERALMAAVILDATDGAPDAVAVARRMVQRLELGAAAEQAVAGLVADSGLLAAAARHQDSLDEESVLQLAVHLRSAEQAKALYVLTLASHDLAPVDEKRLSQLYELVQVALAHPELTGRESANAVEQRRSAAQRLTTDGAVGARIRAAPRAYVLGTDAADLARHAALCEPPPRDGAVRVHVERRNDGRFCVDVVSHDRSGLLAAAAYALNGVGVDVVDATVAVWGDRCALASFRTSLPVESSPAEIENWVLRSLKRPSSAQPLADATIDFDNQSSPWHTICRVRTADRPGVLYAVTTALAASGATVHSARITTNAGGADDVFRLSDGKGQKLSPIAEDTIRLAIVAGGSIPTGQKRRPWKRTWAPRRKSNGHKVVTDVQQAGDESETSAT
ncbi:MAG: cation:proton antiporter [Actinomycetota bacterium]|nr:cation:proton antiporter [Actinomycetota bacterium]